MVVDTYRRLASLIHLTLHTNLRLLALHALSSTIQSSYTPDSPLLDPDPAIQALTATLTAYEADVATYLPPTQSSQVITGLSHFIDTSLLHLYLTRIRALNLDGAALMQLNILVLQQNLKNIESEATLSGAALYFDLFKEGPDAVVARAKERGKGFGERSGLFTEGAVKELLRVCYAGRVGDGRREGGVQARRECESRELEISEYMY